MPRAGRRKALTRVAARQSPNILLARDFTAKLADVGLAKLMMRDCLSTLRDVRARPCPPAALLALPAGRRGRRCDGRACARRWARSPGPPRRCGARAAGAPGLTGCRAQAALMCAALRRCSWASGARSRSTSTRLASSCGARASALRAMRSSTCKQRDVSPVRRADCHWSVAAALGARAPRRAPRAGS